MGGCVCGSCACVNRILSVSKHAQTNARTGVREADPPRACETPNEGDERPNLTSTGPWAGCGYCAINWGTRGPFGGVQGPLSQCTFASTMSHHRATSSGSKGRVTQPRADARRTPRVVSRFLLGRLSGAAAFSTSREANRAGQKEMPPSRSWVRSS